MEDTAAALVRQAGRVIEQATDVLTVTATLSLVRGLCLTGVVPHELPACLVGTITPPGRSSASGTAARGGHEVQQLRLYVDSLREQVAAAAAAGQQAEGVAGSAMQAAVFGRCWAYWADLLLSGAFGARPHGRRGQLHIDPAGYTHPNILGCVLETPLRFKGRNPLGPGEV